MIKKFEDLKIWQKAHQLMLEIYQISNQFPKREEFILISQIRRSSLSVGANIAEGYGRYHKAEYIHFLLNARGSAEETRNHLIAAKDLEYLETSKFNELNNEYSGLIKGINSLIKKLRNCKT